MGQASAGGPAWLAAGSAAAVAGGLHALLAPQLLVGAGAVAAAGGWLRPASGLAVAAAVFWSFSGISGVHPGLWRWALAVAAALLCPVGRGGLLLLAVVALGALNPRGAVPNRAGRHIGAGALGLVWLALDPGAWPAALAVVLGWGAASVAAGAVALMLVALWPLGALTGGAPWVDLFAARAGLGAVLLSPSDGPRFWAAALVALGAAAGWGASAAERRGGLAAAAIGFVVAPFAGLPAAHALTGREPQGALRWLVLPGALLAGAAALVGTTRDAVPAQALEVLRTLPPGLSLALRTETDWALAPKTAWPAGLRVRPGGTAEALREAADSGPLEPPYAAFGEAEEALLLVAPRYPEIPYPRALRPGWALVGAGEAWALYARSTAGLEAWVTARACSAYDPFTGGDRSPERLGQTLAEAARMAEGDPAFFPPRRDAGRAALDLGRADQAEQALRAALALRPDHAECWNDLGTALLLQSRFGEARAAYTESIRLNPWEVIPRMNLASLEARDGHPDEAERLLRDLIGGRPYVHAARRMLAELLLGDGRSGEARYVLSGLPEEERTSEERAFLATAGERP